MNFDSKMADALCTVITAGFINYNEKYGPRTKFVYESGADEALKAKAFVDRLNENGVTLKIEAQDPKTEQPIIFANMKGGISKTEQDSFSSDWKSAIYTIEQRIKESKTQVLRGAYIGGIANFGTGTITLCSPSQLYIYDIPKYGGITINVSTGTVGTSFEAAKKVTNELIDLLEKQVCREILISGIYRKINLES
jgi:hypothetical protein